MWLIHFNTLAYKRMWIVNDECFDIHASIYQWIKILAYGLYRLAMQLLKHPLSHFLKKKIKKRKKEKKMKPNRIYGMWLKERVAKINTHKHWYLHYSTSLGLYLWIEVATILLWRL